MLAGLQRFLLDELASRAEEGDRDAGIELLEWSVSELDAADTPVLVWLKNRLAEIVEDAIEPAKALRIERPMSRGGRPRKFDSAKMMAIDVLLRNHFGVDAKTAAEVLEQCFGIDPRTLRGYRKEFDSRFGDDPEPFMDGSPRKLLEKIAGAELEQALNLLRTDPVWSKTREN